MPDPMYQPDPDRLSTGKTSGAPMPFDVEAFTHQARELVEQGDRVPAQRVDTVGMERRITDPEFDQASYELGYAEGGRSTQADLAAAFDEWCDVPEGVDTWSAWSVAEWVATLQSAATKAEALRDALEDLREPTRAEARYE